MSAGLDHTLAGLAELSGALTSNKLLLARLLPSIMSTLASILR